MAVGSVSPVGIQQFFDNNGAPLAGGKLNFYLAGTTTPTPAYADVGLLTPLANPVILDAAGRAPELFLGALTYKQVLQTALGATLWTADNIVTPSALRSVQSTITLTGSQDNVPVPSGVISFIQCNNAAPLTIGGFAGGTPGQILLIRAGSGGPVHLLNWTNSASLGGTRMVNFVGSGPTSIYAGGMALYVYGGLAADGTNLNWLLFGHTQGRFLDLPYAAGNFTSDTGSWTVPQAQMFECRYLLVGCTIEVTFTVGPTTVAGTPQFLFINNWPFQFVGPSPGQAAQHTGWNMVGPGGVGLVIANVVDNESRIRLPRQDLSLFQAGNTWIYGQARFEVH